jgi:hypothetical protein
MKRLLPGINIYLKIAIVGYALGAIILLVASMIRLLTEHLIVGLGFALMLGLLILLCIGLELEAKD